MKRVRINPRAILLTLRKDSELDILTKDIVVPQVYSDCVINFLGAEIWLLSSLKSYYDIN